MTQHKIIPSLWFHAENGKIEPIIQYYKKIFAEAFAQEAIIPLGQTPSGNAEMCTVHIFGQTYSLMSTQHAHHPFNDALSLTILCENQPEIDAFWDYFTAEGQAVQCGWCTDKYGLRWQIIPENLGELMQKPNAFEVMMRQTKIVIEEYV